MKMRLGFVSNSSSSSFIVSFHTNPKSVEDVQKQMFGHTDENNIWEDNFSTRTIAMAVFDSIQKAGRPANKKEISEAISCGWFEGMPDFPEGDYTTKKWQKYEKECDKVVEKIATKFIKENNGRTIYTFHYSDEDVLGCVMEHSDIFYNLPHKQISCH